MPCTAAGEGLVGGLAWTEGAEAEAEPEEEEEEDIVDRRG
jgi:hypothetical protein